MDRIVLVNEGRIIMDDTPDAVLASGILPRQGIREPLYVTACRYAGIRVTAEMKPSSLSTMDLSKCRAPLQAWYDANKVRTFPVENEPLLEVKNVSFSYNGRNVTVTDMGNGRLDAVSNAIRSYTGAEYSLNTYSEHALEVGSASKAVSYVEIIAGDGKSFWGTGIDNDIITSSVKALVSAVNNMLTKTR